MATTAEELEEAIHAEALGLDHLLAHGSPVHPWMAKLPKAVTG